MSTITRLVTPEDLLRMPDGKSYELVDGELVEREMSTLSSRVAFELARHLGNFVAEHDLGWGFGAENGYQCFPHDPGRVRKPDVSFVTRERLPASEVGQGWTRVAPDLAVEIVSPNDSAKELEEKLADYREASVPVVWVIYPEAGTAYVHRPGARAEYLVGDVELVGEGPLEGFRRKLADLLPRD